MKNKIYLLIIFIFGICLPSKVFGLSGSLNFSCTSGGGKLATNGVSTCTVSYTGNSTEKVGGMEAIISTSGMEVTSTPSVDSFFSNTGTTNSKIMAADMSGTGKTGNIVFATFNVKLTATSGEGSVTLSGIEVASSDGMGTTFGNKTVKFTVASSDANLKSLSVTGCSISPNFNANTTSYSCSTDNASVTINSVANSAGATGAGSITKSLSYGKNQATVTVTAEAGNTKTYTIIITRNDTRNSDNTLKSISLSTGTLSPSFSPNTTNYTVSLPADKDSISVNGIANNGKSSITGGGTKSIAKGATVKFELVVLAENQTTKTYVVNVTRADDRSTDSTLKSLVVKGTSELDIKFSPSKKNYSITVENSLTSVSINAVANDKKAQVSGSVGNQNLNVGSNVFNIKVKAENETSSTYKITIIREDASGNSEEPVYSSLSMLEIEGQNFEFDGNKTNYSLNISSSTTNLNIFFNSLTDNEMVEIYLNGNKIDYLSSEVSNELNLRDLKDGKNELIISISNETGATKDYTITINKGEEEKEDTEKEVAVVAPKKDDNNKSWLLYLAIGLGVIGIAGIIFFIVKKKKGNKKIVVDAPVEKNAEVVTPTNEVPSITTSNNNPVVENTVVQQAPVIEPVQPSVVATPSVVGVPPVSQPVSTSQTIIPQSTVSQPSIQGTSVINSQSVPPIKQVQVVKVQTVNMSQPPVNEPVPTPIVSEPVQPIVSETPVINNDLPVPTQVSDISNLDNN